MAEHTHPHSDDEEIDGHCCACEHGRDQVDKWQVETFSRLGYWIDMVPYKTHVNAHTHGFDISWDHKDFQIVLPLQPQMISSLLHGISERVKEGERFEPGPIKGITKFGAKLVPAQECGREVLRIVIPDQNGLYPGDEGVDAIYGMQETWVDDPE